MVAKIISGKSISGALRYNERKVEQGNAEQLMAYCFPSDKLSFRQKVDRFAALTSQNKRCKTNTVHISLNFDPTEKPDDDKLRQIAVTYMEKIGFVGQPFLLYRHKDTDHPHVHIVTTNIKDGGERIPLHYIGEKVSEPARKEIEQEFNLLPAEGRTKQQEMYLTTGGMEDVLKGKPGTKARISNIVREVVAKYRFASLAELNAILRLRNVLAERGDEGTTMFEKGGLVYYIIDEDGNKRSVPIKASSIYTKPTLAELGKRFEKNKEQKKPLREGVRKIIDTAIKTDTVHSKEDLAKHLALEEIDVVYRQNEAGRIYGITFIDHIGKAVFNGSDLGKDYSAARILQRLSSESKTVRTDRQWNEEYLSSVLRELDYTKGFSSVLASLYSNGIRISARQNNDGQIEYAMGHYRCPMVNHMTADKKLAAYLSVNGMSPQLTTKLTRVRNLYQRSAAISKNHIPSAGGGSPTITDNNHVALTKFIQNFLNVQASHDAPLQPVRKKKRKRNM